MSRRIGIIGYAVGAGMLCLLVAKVHPTITSALAQEQQPEENVSVEEVILQEDSDDETYNYIGLSPWLYVPDKDSLRNKPVDPEDVKLTMNIEAMKLATSAALADLSLGVKTHLGFDEEDITPAQLKFYEENIIYYSNLIQEQTAENSDEETIQGVLDTFNDWVVAYREAIIRDKEEQKLAQEKNLQQVNDTVVNLSSTIIPEEQHISYGIPELGEQYLTYMPYTAITAKSSKQYKLQELAVTDEEGYRTYEGARCVALATSYGAQVGSVYNIAFADGQVMKAVLCDIKSDRHTDSKHQYRDATGAYNGKSGNIVEIVFDTKNHPTVNSVNRKINSDYPAKVIAITKVGVVEGFE